MSARRVGVALTLIAAAALSLAAAPGGSDPGAVGDPSCRVTLVQARESHGARYSTRCNFEQRSIRVKSTSRIYDVDLDPMLSGSLDQGDEIGCRVPAVSRVASCEGSAGSGVRVGGYLETKEFNCEVATSFRIGGGPDCAPELACPAIAYEINKERRRPSTCGPGD